MLFMLARFIGGALSGSIAIGACALGYFLPAWPIGAVINMLTFGRAETAQGGMSPVAGLMMLVLALLCGAAVAGVAGALLSGALRQRVRGRAASEFGRSAITWGIGSAASLVVIILISPMVGDRWAALAAIALAFGAALLFVDERLNRG